MARNSFIGVVVMTSMYCWLSSNCISGLSVNDDSGRYPTNLDYAPTKGIECT